MALLSHNVPKTLQPSAMRRVIGTPLRPLPCITGSKRHLPIARLAQPPSGPDGLGDGPNGSAEAKKLQSAADRLSKELAGSSPSSSAGPAGPKNSEQLISAVDQANAELEKQAAVKELQDEARNLKRDVLGSTKETKPPQSSQQLSAAVSKATAQVGPPVPVEPPKSAASDPKQGSRRSESKGSAGSKPGSSGPAGRGQEQDSVDRAVDDAAESARDAADRVARQMDDAVRDGNAMAADAAEDAIDTAEQMVGQAVDGVARNLQEGIDNVAGLAQGIANAVDDRAAPSDGRRYSWQQQQQQPGVQGSQDVDEAEVERVKVALLGAVSSLDRGLAANVREARDVDNLARQLERLGGPVSLSWKTSRETPNTSTMDRLSGTWRLIYSSGFNGGGLGGRRPGPKVAFVPTVLGQVYQVIDQRLARLDNVVELLLGYSLPRLPFMSSSKPEATPTLRLSLRHQYEVTDANTVRIVYEDTSVRLLGPGPLAQLPVLEPPQLPDFLKLPRGMRSALFGVTYLDDSMRVTRGDRGELRIYLRDEDLDRKAPDYDNMD